MTPPENLMTKQRRATVYDIARMAQVSQTTVSFVLNNTPNTSITEDTRARVLTAAETLGYRPNAMARALRTHQSSFIGFITDFIATTPHAGRIVEGAQQAAWEQGRLLLLVNTGGDPALEAAALDVMIEQRAQAVIYATMYHREAAPPAGLRDLRSVLLDCYAADRGLPCVLPDDRQGGYDATRALIDAGHRRIGFINNHSPIPATFARQAGYAQALADAGIPFDPDLVVSGDVRESECNYRVTQELMRRPNPPTALFVFCDQMVVGVYDALRDMRLRIPEDVAVIGFDNLEIIAATLHPALTTMALPHYEMGAWAVRYVLGQTPDLPADGPVQQLMPCPLVRRQSI